MAKLARFVVTPVAPGLPNPHAAFGWLANQCVTTICFALPWELDFRKSRSGAPRYHPLEDFLPFEHAARRYHALDGHSRHHALQDAHARRRGWLAWMDAKSRRREGSAASTRASSAIRRDFADLFESLKTAVGKDETANAELSVAPSVS